MRRSALMVALICIMLSCETKKTESSNPLILERLASKLDERLLGKWFVQLSCDGSIMCYDCPKVFFKADGFIARNEEAIGNSKWEMIDGNLSITSFNQNLGIEEGMYSIKFAQNNSELELKEKTGLSCYKLSKI
jgi:hypothetical protein